MLPDDLEEEERYTLSSLSEHDYGSSCFYSLSDEERYTLSSNQWKLGKTRCVGSSHGWLILAEDQPYIYNPFRGVSIQLPSLRSFPGFTGNDRKDIYSHTDNDDDLQVEYLLFTHLVSAGWIGDSKWTDLQAANKFSLFYMDVIWCQDHLYALSHKASVEIWDFSSSASSVPVKKMEIEPTFFETEVELKELSRDLYTNQSYIVEAMGEILLVVRYIGQFVGKEDCVPVPKKDRSLYGCTYTTLKFWVFKLDFARTVWEEIESLGDLGLFLGGNHSLSLSTAGHGSPSCRQNSIYFTDANWSEMDSSHWGWAGGHDMGVFNMEDKSIKQVYKTKSPVIQPPPFWVVPGQSTVETVLY
ncbi:hypothetical protein RHSIM_Rhsim04G0081100 [Rhododendron simsii]|uniref:KIB1-4 beta-propeller domain-containing protein n=1 Tax=Rhododendron simsii TaxID=118357 RepID=A0A834H0J7_RHOSS|nr:hypothetical protein RHSIM_Rhsim04G0081100 [Rhododendron simsii]